MPIKPENKIRYPDNWEIEIVPRIRERSEGRCECRGECRSPRCPTNCGHHRCTALDRQPHPITGSRVMLTTAHLNHTPEDCRDDNLKHWCQLCHLAYDAPIHAANRRRTREHQLGLQPLWPDT